MKTFKDLEFVQHPTSKGAGTLPLSMRNKYMNLKQAVMDFDSGYGVSVVLGDVFYSNGVNTYKLGILKGGHLCYDIWVTDDVMGWLTADEVTATMAKVQELKI